MQATNTWYKFDIRRGKIVLILLSLSWFSQQVSAQNYNKDNLADYELEWIHYGFHFGVHNSKYRIKYDDLYTSPALDSLHSAVPSNTAGPRVGFVVNMRLLPFMDLRLLPTFGFYDYRIVYRYTDGRQLEIVKDPATVELPILLKFKSPRHGNIAMYGVAGIAPALEVAGQRDNFNNNNNIKLKNFNLSLDAGIGFDLYFPLFKFSPEIRYNWGLRNMIPGEKGPYTQPFKSLTYENFAFYITFEGGPSYLKYLRKKQKQEKRRR